MLKSIENGCKSIENSQNWSKINYIDHFWLILTIFEKFWSFWWIFQLNANVALARIETGSGHPVIDLANLDVDDNVVKNLDQKHWLKPVIIKIKVEI